MNIKTTSILPEKCPCSYGFYLDRIREGKKKCPACDESLGLTPEIRINNYRTLIATPFSTENIKVREKHENSQWIN